MKKLIIFIHFSSAAAFKLLDSAGFYWRWYKKVKSSQECSWGVWQISMDLFTCSLLHLLSNQPSVHTDSMDLVYVSDVECDEQCRVSFLLCWILIVGKISWGLVNYWWLSTAWRSRDKLSKVKTRLRTETLKTCLTCCQDCGTQKEGAVRSF